MYFLRILEDTFTLMGLFVEVPSSLEASSTSMNIKPYELLWNAKHFRFYNKIAYLIYILREKNTSIDRHMSGGTKFVFQSALGVRTLELLALFEMQFLCFDNYNVITHLHWLYLGNKTYTNRTTCAWRSQVCIAGCV